MKIKILTSTLLLLLFATSMWAQQTHATTPAESKDMNLEAYTKLLRSDLKANKEAVVKEAMQLNDKQQAAFWPIYQEYSNEQSKLYDEKLSIINDYADHFLDMNDAKADQLAQRVMSLDDRKMELRKKYYERMKGALPTVLVVRFFQIDNQLQMIADLQIAANLPIIEEGAGK